MDLKNTNLVEGFEILLPIKFRWIPFSGFREEVENVSANQRPERPSCFSDWLEKHKLGRGRWDLASCQVSLNSVQPFQRRSGKCLSQSEARVAILFFRSARKKQTWLRAFRSSFLSSFVDFRSVVSGKKSKMSQPIRGQGRHLFCPIGLKNTNLVEGLEILLFRWIPFRGFRGEVKNVKVYARRTDDRRCAMTIVHSSLRLRWAKKGASCLCLDEKNLVYGQGIQQKPAGRSNPEIPKVTRPLDISGKMKSQSGKINPDTRPVVWWKLLL